MRCGEAIGTEENIGCGWCIANAREDRAAEEEEPVEDEEIVDKVRVRSGASDLVLGPVIEWDGLWLLTCTGNVDTDRALDTDVLRWERHGLCVVSSGDPEAGEDTSGSMIPLVITGGDIDTSGLTVRGANGDGRTLGCPKDWPRNKGWGRLSSFRL